MSRKYTTEIFIQKAQLIHGTIRYLYPETDYINSYTKVKIFCTKCNNNFFQTPHSHLKGYGCMCNNSKVNKFKDTSKFIAEAKEIHENKYLYPQTEYKGMRGKVKIFCTRCDTSFWQKAGSHLNGHGCLCWYTKTTEEFIEEAKLVHGDAFSYDRTKYVNAKTEVEIYCKSGKHYFYQIPHRHLNGKGCNICNTNFQLNTEIFIERSNIAHGIGRYLYDKSIYTCGHEKIEIYCTVCESYFWQDAGCHMRGFGCKKCAMRAQVVIVKKANTLSQEEFIARCHEEHPNMFDYSLTKYTKMKDPIDIICKTHNITFTQSARVHLSTYICCPMCINEYKTSSYLERKWLDSLGIPNDREHRGVRININDSKYFIVDGFNSNTKQVYEFNGDFWHGNPEIYNPKELNRLANKTFEELYIKTINKEKILIEAGYKVISIWASDYRKQIGYL